MIQLHNMLMLELEMLEVTLSLCVTEWSGALNVLLIWVSLTSTALGHKALQNAQGKRKSVFSPLLCFPHISCPSVSFQGPFSSPVDPSSAAVSMPSCQGLFILSKYKSHTVSDRLNTDLLMCGEAKES